MQEPKTKTIIVTNIVILLLLSASIPTSPAISEKNESLYLNQLLSSTTNGILYVGGTGPGNYSIIQDAIDAATNGDTIYVYDNSAPYYEHLVVDKSIQLRGENKDTTILDGNRSGEVNNIGAESTQISGFTIQYGTLGIYVQSNNITITNNKIIHNHEEGIYLSDSEEITISFNTISDNEDGVELEDSQGNLILKNNISNNADHGIEIINTKNEPSYNIIKNNQIASNIKGIYLENSSSNEILRNNFIDNQNSATFINCKNKWTHNFWDKARILLKIIFGKIMVGPIPLPWINIDWRPASIQNIWYKTALAIIDTTMGTMTLDLYYEIMPITSKNFKDLADIDFFNGLVFHRTIKDFVIQGGGYYPNGTRKDSPFGPINLETHPDIIHVDGAISMARTPDPNSATSQFFICDTAQPHLDGNYSAFGKIVDGINVLRAIAAVETTMKYGLSNWPVDDIIINSIIVKDW